MDTGIKSNYISETWFLATVAQLVEHLTRNEDVCGSIPHGGSNLIISILNKIRKSFLDWINPPEAGKQDRQESFRFLIYRILLY